MKAVLGWILTFLSLYASVTAQHGRNSNLPEDLAGQVCTDFFNQGFKWPICKGKGGKGGKGGHGPDTTCWCQEQMYLDSLMGCIDNIATDNIKSHYKYVLAYCAKSVTKDDLDEAVSRIPELPLLEIPMPHYGARPVKKAFKLPEIDYERAVKTYTTNNGRNDKSIKYAYSMMCFWFGVVLLRMIFHWTRNFFPTVPHKLDSKFMRWVRKNFTVPPMIKYKHSTPATLGNSRLGRFFTFNLPTRQSTLIILAFTTVHMALLFGSLNVLDYNYSSKLDNWGAQYSKSLGIRSGWFIVFLMPPMFLFGGRNNFMIHLTGWPLDEFSVFHKWLGRFCFIDLLVHAAAYTWLYIHLNRFDNVWNQAYWNHGVASTVFGCIMVFFAAHCFRKISYEIFLVTHILLAIGFLVGGYYHILLLNDEVRPYYACIAIWGFDRAMRLGRILLASPFSRAKVDYHNGHTIELTITYSKLWKVPAGSYIFVHIVQPMFFWESHPFTVMRSVKGDEEGTIKLYCRGMNGMTKRLVDKCQKNNGSFETYVWLDGPYHHYVNMNAFKEALLIGGGIGITAPFSFAQGFINKGFKDITIHWGIRDTAPLEWFSNEIDYLLQNGVKLYIHVGDESPTSSSNVSFASDDKEKSLVSTTSNVKMSQGRMNIMNIVTEAATNASGPMAVMTCGPGPVNDLSRKAVVANLSTSPHYIEYFEESFSW